MASSSPSNFTVFSITITLLLVLCSFTGATASNGLILTLVNNCPFPVWPAIQSNAGLPVLERGGFSLNTLAYRSFPAPAQPWSGRIWARTGCSYSNNNHFSCVTGDCCGGKVECDGSGGATPATLAQFSLHHGPNDLSTYSVSLVDGFNVPLTVTPHEGQGICPVVGCRADLLATCPASLEFRCPPGGPVVGCRSGCGAFGTDDLCCRNSYAAPPACKPSGYSQFFKNDCPATFTYPQDTPSLVPQCSSPRELKVIFCH